MLTTTLVEGAIWFVYIISTKRRKSDSQNRGIVMFAVVKYV